MTCAHIVNVALKKVPGVESVDVGLNRGIANVKLKAGNTVTIAQLWRLVHNLGYTTKAATMRVRGEVEQVPGSTRLNVAGTKESLLLVADPRNATAYDEVLRRGRGSTTVYGTMVFGKELKQSAPLAVTQVR